MICRAVSGFILLVVPLFTNSAFGGDDVQEIKMTFERIGTACSKKVETVFEDNYFSDRELGCEVRDENSQLTFRSSLGGNFLADLIFLREAVCQATDRKEIPPSTEVICYQSRGDTWPRSEQHAARREAYEFLANHILRGNFVTTPKLQFQINRKNDGNLEQAIEYATPLAHDRQSMNLFLSRKDRSHLLSLQEINGELFLVHKESKIPFTFKKYRHPSHHCQKCQYGVSQVLREKGLLSRGREVTFALLP